MGPGRVQIRFTLSIRLEQKLPEQSEPKTTLRLFLRFQFRRQNAQLDQDILTFLMFNFIFYVFFFF